MVLFQQYAAPLHVNKIIGEKVLERNALQGLPLEKALKEGQTGRGEVHTRGDLQRPLYHPQELGLILGREGGSSCHHLEEDSTHGPEIGLGVVLVVAQDLRSHVEGRSTEGLGHAAPFKVAREAEVCDLQHSMRRILSQKEVLRLYIAVHEIAIVQKFQSCSQVSQEMLSRSLPKPGAWLVLDKPLEITSPAVFQDNINMFITSFDIVKPHDVAMGMIL